MKPISRSSLDKNDEKVQLWIFTQEHAKKKEKKPLSLFSKLVLTYLFEKYFPAEALLPSEAVIMPSPSLFLPVVDKDSKDTQLEKYISRSPRNKPLLLMNPSFSIKSFSITHTGHTLALLFSTGLSCGIDIEVFEPTQRKRQGLKPRKARELLAIAKRFFHPKEYDAMLRLYEEEQMPSNTFKARPKNLKAYEAAVLYFYRNWTLKEAAAKTLDSSLFEILHTSKDELQRKIHCFHLTLLEKHGFSAAFGGSKAEKSGQAGNHAFSNKNLYPEEIKVVKLRFQAVLNENSESLPLKGFRIHRQNDTKLILN